MPSGLFAFLDDAATMMRHTVSTTSPAKVLAATKSATLKTTGVMSDDLAIKSKGVIGIDPSREIPIVGKIFKKCLQNLCWILPGILTVSVAAPAALPFITAGGGAFLAFEGAHSLYHVMQNKFGKHPIHHDDTTNQLGETPEEIEDRLVRDNVKIGIINSAEMVLIAMATIGNQPLATQIPAVIANSAMMAGVVHGVVLGIVRLDDMGLHLSAKEGSNPFDIAQRMLGRGMLKTLPFIMNQLPTLGLTAMFTVGGELVGKHIPVVESIFHAVEHGVHAVMPAIPVLPEIATFAANMGVTGAFGIGIGFAAFGAEKILAPPIRKYVAPVLKPVFEKIGEGLNGLSAGLKKAIDFILSPVKKGASATKETLTSLFKKESGTAIAQAPLTVPDMPAINLPTKTAPSLAGQAFTPAVSGDAATVPPPVQEQTILPPAKPSPTAEEPNPF